MTDFYLAARFDTRAALRQTVALPLMEAGHRITSSWMARPQEWSALPDSDAVRAGEAQSCLDDIDNAQAVAFFTEHESTTGGWHVEFGYALAKGKRIYVVGPKRNVFHSLPGVVYCAGAEAFLSACETS